MNGQPQMCTFPLTHSPCLLLPLAYGSLFILPFQLSLSSRFLKTHYTHTHTHLHYTHLHTHTYTTHTHTLYNSVHTRSVHTSPLHTYCLYYILYFPDTLSPFSLHSLSLPLSISLSLSLFL